MARIAQPTRICEGYNQPIKATCTSNTKILISSWEGRTRQRNQECNASRALWGMQPRATRAHCRGQAILTPHKNQRRPTTVLHTPGALHHAVTIQVSNYHRVHVAVAERFASLPNLLCYATSLAPNHHASEPPPWLDAYLASVDGMVKAPTAH